MAPATAVIICAYTHERWDDTVASIRSALSQRWAPTEVVVVVDHDPGLAEELRSVDQRVHVIENRGARGLSGARNTGVAHARAEVVAFLDDDAEASPGWLEELVRPY